MKPVVCVACLLLLAQALAFADDKPFTKTWTEHRTATEKLPTLIGGNGVLVIRSEMRWDSFWARILPDAVIIDLPKVDFTKQSIVVLYVHGVGPKDTLELAKSDPAANPPQFAFMLRTQRNDGNVLLESVNQFIYAVVPATPPVKIMLQSSPQNQDRSVAPVLEFSAIIGDKAGGDIVDGLQAAIEAKSATIKPGEDILIDFELHLADPGDAKPQQFGKNPKSVSVWDGKYSEGYRNHGFFVTTPNGKTTLLRPPEIKEWLKNAPHPVEITAKEPYHLSNWVEGDKYKSLKALGLDTSAPGTYTITGLYEETASAKTEDAKPLWGGSITTNTITVEVK